MFVQGQWFSMSLAQTEVLKEDKVSCAVPRVKAIQTKAIGFKPVNMNLDLGDEKKCHSFIAGWMVQQ